eukprot:scaffold317249_cov32-Tisochrysis_lutea.AAC.2
MRFDQWPTNIVSLAFQSGCQLGVYPKLTDAMVILAHCGNPGTFAESKCRTVALENPAAAAALVALLGRQFGRSAEGAGSHEPSHTAAHRAGRARAGRWRNRGSHCRTAAGR